MSALLNAVLELSKLIDKIPGVQIKDIDKLRIPLKCTQGAASLHCQKSRGAITDAFSSDGRADPESTDEGSRNIFKD